MQRRDSSGLRLGVVSGDADSNRFISFAVAHKALDDFEYFDGILLEGFVEEQERGV